jgi:predicted ester cyclase
MNSIKDIAKEYANKIWNEKDVSAIDKLVQNSVIIHSSLGEFLGIDALKNVVHVWLNAFPDLRIYNDIIISEKDIVSIQWHGHGTHRGELKDKKPTGKIVSYSGATIYRIKNQKICEIWTYLDMHHLLNQL